MNQNGDNDFRSACTHLMFAAANKCVEMGQAQNVHPMQTVVDIMAALSHVMCRLAKESGGCRECIAESFAEDLEHFEVDVGKSHNSAHQAN